MTLGKLDESGRELPSPLREAEYERPVVGDGLAIRLQIPATDSISYSQTHHPQMHLDSLPSVRLLVPPSEDVVGTPPPFPQRHMFSRPELLERQQLQIPSIHVHAATPSPVSMHHPTPSPTSSISPSSAGCMRKQRFTMGPRADCEKCRAGIRGHWVHFD